MFRGTGLKFFQRKKNNNNNIYTILSFWEKKTALLSNKIKSNKLSNGFTHDPILKAMVKYEEQMLNNKNNAAMVSRFEQEYQKIIDELIGNCHSK